MVVIQICGLVRGDERLISNVQGFLNGIYPPCLVSRALFSVFPPGSRAADSSRRTAEAQNQAVPPETGAGSFTPAGMQDHRICSSSLELTIFYSF